MASLEEALCAKPKLLEALKNQADVAGIGLQGSEDSFALSVHLRTLPAGLLPESFQGIPVRYKHVGDIHAL